ncbi:MAG: hypothetical protein WCK58_11015 [Chloroflexota bacterium]
MTHGRRLLAGAFGLAILVAACGGASATPGGTSGAGGTAAPPATQAAATEAPAVTEAPAATDGGGGSVATEDPAAMNGLANELPAEANGVKYQRAGFDGAQFGAMGAAAGLSSDQMGKVLSDNGKTINDVNYAIATPADSSATTGGMIYAIQIKGVPATKWMGEMGQDPTASPKVKLGGKDVYGQAAGGFGMFAYPKDDKLFLLILVDEKQAAAILEKLP